jgi:vesicle coat complex subunit
VFVFQLVIVLKKEVIKTNNVTEHEDTDKFRQLLVRTLHSCSVRFPDMAANVIPVVSLPCSHIQTLKSNTARADGVPE